MPWAAGGIDDVGPMLRSVLIMGGEEDSYAVYPGQQADYEVSPSPKRLVGVARAGHLWCTDMCWIGEADGGILQIGIEYVFPDRVACTSSARRLTSRPMQRRMHG